MNGKELLKGYIEKFNANDFENYTPQIGNEQAYDFLADQIPFLHCPDKAIEETYYFRFWTLRKHIKHTEECGFVFTEFAVPFHDFRDGFCHDEAGFFLGEAFHGFGQAVTEPQPGNHDAGLPGAGNGGGGEFCHGFLASVGE